MNGVTVWDGRAGRNGAREALRSCPRRRPRPRILASGVMARPHRYAKRCGREFWSTGVLRIVGIAPRVRGVGGAFRAVFGLVHPGLKPGLFCATVSWSKTRGHQHSGAASLTEKKR
jgi:hypothetical protein